MIGALAWTLILSLASGVQQSHDLGIVPEEDCWAGSRPVEIDRCPCAARHVNGIVVLQIETLERQRRLELCGRRLARQEGLADEVVGLPGLLRSVDRSLGPRRPCRPWRRHGTPGPLIARPARR